MRGVPLKRHTVTARTREHYVYAANTFLQFVLTMGLTAEAHRDLDAVMCEYVEKLWADFDSHGLAVYTIAGICWLVPRLKQEFDGARALIATWAKMEPPSRATPFTPGVALGLAGLAIGSDLLDIGTLILVGFETFLRSGELFSLTTEDVSFYGDRVILRIRQAKIGQRIGIHESVVLPTGLAATWLRKLVSLTPPGETLLRRPAYQARKVLAMLLEVAGLEDFGFTWYSLRRGGATYFFRAHKTWTAL